jgi:hypothetical protein
MFKFGWSFKPTLKDEVLLIRKLVITAEVRFP